MADLNTIGGLHYEMMRRCYNEKSIAFESYGGKGVEVCEEWHDRERFRKWALENGYKKGLRLERIDGKGNYEPSNCRFGVRNAYKNGIAKHTREVKIHRREMKELCGVPQKYSHLRIYRIFVGMHARCEIPTHTNYENYGGREISVCDEWSGEDGFFYFYKWAMENGYNNKLSLNRIDNNKGYSADNCKWETDRNQIENRRVSRMFPYNGKEAWLPDIAREEKIKYGLLYSRVVLKGMSVQEAIEDIRKCTE